MPPSRSGLGPLPAATLAALLAAGTALATDLDLARVKQGANIFRSILASDLDLASKAREDGALIVVVYHAGREDLSRLAAEVIGAGGRKLAGHSLEVLTVTSLEVVTVRPAALFVAESLERSALDALVRWALESRVFVFSPHEGHVERGVAAGVSVGAQVLPYLNRATLQRTGLRFRPIVMEVSRFHEGGR